MKKTRIVSISLLSAVLLLCFMDFSVAAPPSYVGIRTGETYTWKADLAADNLNTTANALFGDNWTFMYEYLSEWWQNNTYCPFNFMQGAGMRLVLTNVSDELNTPSYYPIPEASGLYFDEYISFCNDNYTLVVNSSVYSSPMMYLNDPTYFNSTNWQLYIAGGGMPVFVPIGLNWVLIATYWNTHILTSPYTAGNVTVSALSNGLIINLNDKYLEWVLKMMGGENYTVGTLSLSNAEISLTWNAKGVFTRGEVEYGDLLMATGYLEGEGVGGIPGYELTILFGLTLASTVGLIYSIMKKRKK
jgi:hypothetical protein